MCVSSFFSKGVSNVLQVCFKVVLKERISRVFPHIFKGVLRVFQVSSFKICLNGHFKKSFSVFSKVVIFSENKFTFYFCGCLHCKSHFSWLHLYWLSSGDITKEYIG